MKRLHYCVLLFSLLVMTSCLDDSNKTVVLPSGVISKEVIPNEIRNMLEGYMPIYEGFDAPVISGSYLADKVTARYCSDNNYAPGKIIADQYMYFGHQNASGIIYKFEGKQGKSVETSNLVQVVGENNNFTAFYVTDGLLDWDDDGVFETWSKVSTLISGEVTNQGIQNWTIAIIMVDKNDPLDVLMERNVYRVFYEGDNMSNRISDWRSKMPALRDTCAYNRNECNDLLMISSQNNGENE